MILLPAFMSLAGGSHSILHQGDHLFSFVVHIQVMYHVGHAADIMSVNFDCFRWKGESLRESIKRHEHFLALQLGLKSGQKVFALLKNMDILYMGIQNFSLSLNCDVGLLLVLK